MKKNVQAGNHGPICEPQANNIQIGKQPHLAVVAQWDCGKSSKCRVQISNKKIGEMPIYFSWWMWADCKFPLCATMGPFPHVRFKLRFACFHQLSCRTARFSSDTTKQKIKSAKCRFIFRGGCGRTRTADPYDVNVVL